MALTTVRTSQKHKLNTPNKQQIAPNNFMFTILATFGGVMLGVLASLGVMRADMHSQFAAETASLNHQMVRLADANVAAGGQFGQCSAPAGSAGQSSAVTAAASVGNSSSQPNGMSGGSGANGPTFVHKLVSGVFANDTAAISNTGADSNNQVSFENSVQTTVTNTNNLSLNSSNSQTAVSGDAYSSRNTAAGPVATGSAQNSSIVDLTYNVTN